MLSSCGMEKKLSYNKYSKTINFSGQEWVVKDSDVPTGPGTNYFSDDPNSVWIDQEGFLHLKIRKLNGIWHCAEIVSKKTLGYGKYEFIIGSDLSRLDRNVVLGLFTWDDQNKHNHREIDIEFAKWGSQTTNYNAQYVVQPHNLRNNRFRYNAGSFVGETTHSFNWTRDSVNFKSAYGSTMSDSGNMAVINRWTNKGRDIPPSRFEKIRINLWLLTGKKPVDEKETEIIIKAFNFIPNARN